MKVKIFQINSDRDHNRVKFMGRNFTESLGGIDAKAYDLVFDGHVSAGDLEEVYTIFNIYKPDEYTGHSLSVSDVVVNEDGCWFCDSFGFSKIDGDAAAVFGGVADAESEN